MARHYIRPLCVVLAIVQLNLIMNLCQRDIFQIQNKNFHPLSNRPLIAKLRNFCQMTLLNSHILNMGKLSLQFFFCDPKKETGKVRVIFNLKHLNEAVTYRKFKMDTLESAIKLMKPGCFMTSIDLRDAYYSVPITPEHRKYLKFMWRGVLYQFTSLPMGLTSSPRIFTKILKPVFATLRSRYGHCCLGYIDDSIYLKIR